MLRTSPWWLILGGAALLCVLLLPIPGHSLFHSSLQNSGHALLFALLSMLTASRMRLATAAGLALPAFRVVGSLLLFGLCIELVQSLTGRNASLLDLILNLAGSIAGLLLFAACSRKAGLPLLHRIIAAMVALLVLSVCFSKPAEFALARWFQADPPVIADFENSLATKYLSTKDDTHLSLVSAENIWQGHSGQVLRIDFAIGKYPGVTFLEPMSDWRGYSRLLLTLFNPETIEQRITLRISDVWHNGEFTDRFNRELTLLPGETLVDIPLEAIRRHATNDTPTRPLDLSQITDLTIFRSNSTSASTLFIDDLTLD